MGRYDALIDLLLETVKEGNVQLPPNSVPVGVSNRHVHLSQADLEILFGAGAFILRNRVPPSAGKG